MKMVHGALLAVAGILSVQATAAEATSYYLFDGDSSKAIEIANGAVVRSFNTFSLGYAAAVTDTIWLGGRDNGGAKQYALNGTATGATGAAGSTISQLLDGTSNGTNNFGVTCCGSTNVVTIANTDWSNQRVLFNLAGGSNGDGIAYNSKSNSLYVSSFDNMVTNYSMTGSVLGSFSLGGTVVGLAYEQSSDTLWGWNRSTSSLQQFSMTGYVLQTQAINASSYGVFNPFGGEMAIAATAAVPEPATWAMMVGGFGVIGGAMRSRRKSAVRFA